MSQVIKGRHFFFVKLQNSLQFELIKRVWVDELCQASLKLSHLED